MVGWLVGCLSPGPKYLIKSPCEVVWTHISYTASQGMMSGVWGVWEVSGGGWRYLCLCDICARGGCLRVARSEIRVVNQTFALFTLGPVLFWPRDDFRCLGGVWRCLEVFGECSCDICARERCLRVVRSEVRVFNQTFAQFTLGLLWNIFEKIETRYWGKWFKLRRHSDNPTSCLWLSNRSLSQH